MDRVVDPTAFPPKAEPTISDVTEGPGARSSAHLARLIQAHGPVRIFVRKGSYEGERVLAFSLPEGLKSADIMEIIRRGFAIDGNRAMMVVSWYSRLDPETGRLITEWNPQDESGRMDESSPSDQVWVNHWLGIATPLREAEHSLIEWLSNLGYEVEFK